ncbi:hypothetical protein K7X08_036519 [Anisodus acutangulus]|uniref:Uncharacterized protein n=1 Tax=Anisodus acutangulus TaxID=402998 RepID=A0A9Q1L6H9_9SOLA|nr:hypothetical protein K7X08_036519 [Anisodus acutangulus]
MIIEDEIQYSACLIIVNEKPDPIAMQASRNQGITLIIKDYRGRKPFLQCEYCHFTGHTKENRYKLIGYPADGKQKKRTCYGGGYAKNGAGHGNAGSHGGHVGGTGQYGGQGYVNSKSYGG